MNILITGGAGLIGSHLCDTVLQKKHYVTIMDNLSFGRHVNPRATFIDKDVRDLDSHIIPYDIIYHLASLKKVWDGSINSSEVMDVNYDMTRAVVDKALHDYHVD